MNLTAVDITASSVLLNWNEPKVQIYRYHVEYEDTNLIAENTSVKINYLIPGAQCVYNCSWSCTEGTANQISLNTRKRSDWMFN